VATRRQRQAEQTHREILDAARKLFAHNGYAGTTVVAIADEAGVSVQTIYDSIGSKAAILTELNDLIDELAGIPEVAARIPTTTDPIELLEVPVEIIRRVMEHVGDIMRTALTASEPELLRVADESRRRHRFGAGLVVQRLADVGGLPPGTDVERAADIVAALCHPIFWAILLDEYGWTVDEAAAWTLASLRQLVLGELPT